jgi:DNA-binding transcriptional MerR regulator
MEKYYTVKDVSERTGISAYTLRYYDKEGLLTFVKRDASGRRLFTEDDFQPLYTIAVLKRIGMPIKDIREFIELYQQGNSTIHDRLRLFQEYRKHLQDKIDELNEMMKIVDYKCWYFEEAEKRNDIDYYLKLPKEEVDPRIIEFNEKVKDFRFIKESSPEE